MGATAAAEPTFELVPLDGAERVPDEEHPDPRRRAEVIAALPQTYEDARLSGNVQMVRWLEGCAWTFGYRLARVPVAAVATHATAPAHATAPVVATALAPDVSLLPSPPEVQATADAETPIAVTSCAIVQPTHERLEQVSSKRGRARLLAAEGRSDLQIALEIGVARTTVWRWRRSMATNVGAPLAVAAPVKAER